MRRAGLALRAIQPRLSRIQVPRSGEPPARCFATEAGALERLRHPAVVRYLSHGLSDEGEPYLAMEWLEGETLHARLERGPLDPDDAEAELLSWWRNR